jgi:hypothetical protein
VHHDILAILKSYDIANPDMGGFRLADLDHVIHLNHRAHTARYYLETEVPPFLADLPPHFFQDNLGYTNQAVSWQLTFSIWFGVKRWHLGDIVTID